MRNEGGAVDRETKDHNGYCAFIVSATAITEVLDDLTIARLTSVSRDMHIEKISKPQVWPQSLPRRQEDLIRSLTLPRALNSRGVLLQGPSSAWTAVIQDYPLR